MENQFLLFFEKRPTEAYEKRTKMVWNEKAWNE